MPPAFSYLRIGGITDAPSGRIQSGTYVSVDHEYVGGLSDRGGQGLDVAVDRGSLGGVWGANMRVVRTPGFDN